MRPDDAEPPLAEEVLAESERHRYVECADKCGGKRECVGLDQCGFNTVCREQLLRPLEGGRRLVEQRHVRAAPRIQDRAGATAGADLDHAKAVERAEVLRYDALLREPPRRSHLLVRHAEIDGLDLPLPIPVGRVFDWRHPVDPSRKDCGFLRRRLRHRRARATPARPRRCRGSRCSGRRAPARRRNLPPGHVA